MAIYLKCEFIFFIAQLCFILKSDDYFKIKNKDCIPSINTSQHTKYYQTETIEIRHSKPLFMLKTSFNLNFSLFLCELNR